MAKLHLITYGCQMNEYDSERVAGLLRERSWELTADEAEADLILVNTCAIREKAEDKVFSKLGELRLLKAQKPELIIGVMGCMAQLHQGAIQRRAPSVDLVFGSPAIARVAELIVEEVRRLAADGCREVTLLGQTVNAYGRDLTPRTDLGELFARVDEVEDIARIRFTTSNPYNLTPKLIRAMRDVPKVCEYFHLPLQSGSNDVLERMNRGYTRERYLELVAEIRDAVPEMAFSTDLIVGFPGETEADFEQTLEMVDRVGYDNVFVFRYSRRPGTPAATMADQVADDVKARRNLRLLEAAARVATERSRRLAGQTVEVLIDGRSKKNARELSGRTRCNRVVNFDGQGSASVGDLAQIHIDQVLPHSLRGTLASQPEEAACLSK